MLPGFDLVLVFNFGFAIENLFDDHLIQVCFLTVDLNLSTCCNSAYSQLSLLPDCRTVALSGFELSIPS